MKSSFPRVIQMMVFLALMLCVSSVQSLEVIPPTINDLKGNWIGQSDAGAFARLSLASDGNGILALNYYSSQPIWLFRVKVSKPSKNPLGWELLIHSTPIGHRHAISIASAKVSIDRITIVMQGDISKSTYSLSPELDAMTRYNKMIRNSVMQACLANGC